ncbi:hypothetical protein G6130_000555 [Salmonella enterica]|nr:hypothetical protein [Salmonella enterica]
MQLRPLNERNRDKKDYLYQPRLFRRGYQVAGKRGSHTGVMFIAGVLTGVLLTMVSLLLYPQMVMALLRVMLQVVHAAGYRSL